ncbi:MAG: hypothetical protein JSU03_10080 [Bacteroidetes bacterium]|nr:hypothetical protein [Bacteroidota bacterium]MBS1757616.1 hypothetical protein [Bacteroidota bacterium]
MKAKQLFIVMAALFFANQLFAQRVKRKGTMPIDVTKNVAKSSPTFMLTQVQGKWQEYSRTDILNNQKTNFADTLMLTINNNNAEVKEGMSMTMKGEAAIESRNELYVAGDSYSIVSISDSQLVLNDGEYFKTLKQVPFFYLETVGKDSVKQVAYSFPKNVLMSDILGTWQVYKKEAKPGIINKNTCLVNTISIIKNSNQNIATGEITMSIDNVSQKYPCTFILKDSTLQILANNQTLNFNTYQAANGEFIFGDKNQVLNFAKKN